MPPRPRLSSTLLTGIFAVLGSLSALLIFGGSVVPQAPHHGRATDDVSRLVSIQPLPDEAECQWRPASASATLRLARQQGAAPSAAGQAALPRDFSERKPVRTIQDPYAGLSAVAVDPLRNEVVLADENRFNLLVYDRLTHTPPSARMSEPKRMIGGVRTRVEFQCAVYIDPASGDIYAVNNDTVDMLVIFGRQAEGNVPPDRALHTPHGTFGIAVDEDAREMYLTIQHDNAVVVYDKMAQDHVPPSRLLQGSRTQLADPHGIAVDTKNGLMLVSNYGSFHEILPGETEEARPNWPAGKHQPGSGKFLPPSITVYPLNASGDTAPLRVIQGSQTQLDWPSGLSVDAERGELYVANDMGDSILVFSTSASGDAAPVRVLKGPKTLIKNPTGIALDLKNDELWVANFGNHAATVYKRNASGDAAPLRVIRTGPIQEPALGLGNPFALAYDSKRDEILVPN